MARPSLHMSKCHIVGNHMSWLICIYFTFSFEQFLKMSHLLSQLDSYPQLSQRADRIGYEVQKIVFRGYHSSDQLQVG